MTDPTDTAKPSTLSRILTVLALVLAALPAAGVFAGAPSWVTQLDTGLLVALTAAGYYSHGVTLAAATSPAASYRKPQSGSASLLGMLWAICIATIIWTLVVTAPACTHPQVVAAENAAETCGESQGLAQLATVAKDLASPSFEQALTSDASLIGLSTAAVTCLVQVVVAVITARDNGATAGSGSATLSTSMSAPPDPALVHGRIWLARHAGQ